MMNDTRVPPAGDRIRIAALAIFAAGVWAQAPNTAAPDVILLNDAVLGTVTFQHKMHEERAEGKCETCHHGSKPEKPEARPYQACRDCHTKQPQEGMKTSRQAAFHNPPALSGTCVDCHKRQIASGKKPPQKCFDCHRKESRAAGAAARADFGRLWPVPFQDPGPWRQAMR